MVRYLLLLVASVLSAISYAESFGSNPENFVLIPAGTYMMGDILGEGDAMERPAHEVTVKAFAMGRTEVTFHDYDQFATATGRKLPDDMGWGRDDRPVINVSWYDAQAYIEWINLETKSQYRLPTEAEWEYASRANTQTRFNFGDKIDCSKARFGNVLCGQSSARVGSFEANNFGLYDMHGNVWEWTQDCWHENYQGAPSDGSAWIEKNCSMRTLRGGSWFCETSRLRVTIRTHLAPDQGPGSAGFRLAHDLNP